MSKMYGSKVLWLCTRKLDKQKKRKKRYELKVIKHGDNHNKMYTMQKWKQTTGS